MIDPSEVERIEEVGRGAFGVVWRAEWRSMSVCLKDVHDKEGLEDLMREANEMMALQPHNNVVQFYGICRVDDSTSSLVTAFCERGALKDVCFPHQWCQRC